MSIRITDLHDLDAVRVQQEHELIVEMIQEANPRMFLRRGVLHDTLGLYGGVLAAKNQIEQDRQRRSTSLAEIIADPSLADEETIDNVASNYRITRLAGDYAEGQVVVVLDSAVTLTIPNGTTFETDGKEFQTIQGFTSQPSAEAVTGPGDRVLTPLENGEYSFLIDVVATEKGETSRLRKDVLIVPGLTFSNYVTSYAAADFAGGESDETNQGLADRLAYGMTVKAFSGRDHMGAAMRNEEAFERILDDSIIGMGDSEMLRDRHTIFPGSHGGRVDWYVRTQELPQALGFTKTATLIEKTVGGCGIWQIAFNRDEAPGLYQVQSIRPLSSVPAVTGYEITQDIRSLDMTALDNDGFLPDIQDVAAGVYSRFQAVIIRFEDTDTDTDLLTEGNSTADYAVTVLAMPLIADIQDFALDRRVRNTMGDCLVKAPMPCFLSLSFDIELPSGDAVPNLSGIKDDLAALVNQYGFTGRLPASALADVVHNHLQGRASSSAIDMFGRIRRPDGTLAYVRSEELLEVPNEPQNMVTSRTVAFILDPADVAISVVTADIAEV